MNATPFDQVWDSLRVVLDEPFYWWRLTIKGNCIKRAPLSVRFSQWITSFFTLSSQKKLTQSLLKILSQASAVSEEEKIILEKIETLMLFPKAWFFKLLMHAEVSKVHSYFQFNSALHPIERNGVFYNEEGERIWKQFWTTINLLFLRTKTPFSTQDLKTWNRQAWEPCARSIEPKITWMGHASLLIQIAGFNLLLDPSFQFVFPCYKRHTSSGIAFEALPKIDILGISHNHGDHYEVKALKRLMPYQPFAFVPQRLDPHLKKMGYQRAEGKKWWEQTTFIREGRTLKVTAIPAQHSSQSSLFDLNRTLWMGLMIEAEDFKIYFSGDTGFKEEIFQEIKAMFGPIDVALLPIAPDEEKAMHLNHEEALEAFRILDAKLMIPIHWGAYRTGKEQIETPLYGLKALANQDPSLTGKIIYPKLGETVILGDSF